jgi:hypothetical protein
MFRKCRSVRSVPDHFSVKLWPLANVGHMFEDEYNRTSLPDLALSGRASSQNKPRRSRPYWDGRTSLSVGSNLPSLSVAVWVRWWVP